MVSGVHAALTLGCQQLESPGWEYSSVAQHWPGRRKVMSSIPGTQSWTFTECMCCRILWIFLTRCRRNQSGRSSTLALHGAGHCGMKDAEGTLFTFPGPRLHQLQGDTRCLTCCGRTGVGHRLGSSAARRGNQGSTSSVGRPGHPQRKLAGGLGPSPVSSKATGHGGLGAQAWVKARWLENSQSAPAAGLGQPGRRRGKRELGSNLKAKGAQGLRWDCGVEHLNSTRPPSTGRETGEDSGFQEGCPSILLGWGDSRTTTLG